MNKAPPEVPMLEKWWNPFPRDVPPDTRRLLLAKALRAFTDGLVSIVLPVYLLRLGYNALHVGAIVTSTLLEIRAAGPERWMRLIAAPVCFDGRAVRMHGLKLAS